jgi:serine/threonine-protein kinase
MGEVYRATDTNLKRDVAIKILPKAFADDADRVARFQREAEALAALNHSNIAQIYGFERGEGSTALVMELVEGPTLAERIAQGPIPYDEALGIAMQIIAALEAAHGKGIVHRDLKPANVKVRPDGTVKVLDFGIATAPESPLATSGRRSPALLTPALTEAGILLGTAAYMSPEQARGKPVDERADIWAFGCVLYEMLTGQPAFQGEDVTTTLARVLERETDLGSLPPSVPPVVRHTLELCLEKDPGKRIADIRDVRLALDGRFETETRLGAGQGATARPAWWRALLPGAALLAGAVVTGLAAWSFWPMPDLTVTRFSIDLEGQSVGFEPIALSPDGRRIVYAANQQLYSRRLDQDAATPIPGTTEALNPFFSPDGEAVAFFTPTQLKVVGFGGEVPRVLADIETSNGLVGAWDEQGRIFFGQGGRYGLSFVPAVGGKPEPFADLADYEDLDYPDVLPGGEWVLFTANLTEGDWSGSDVVAQNIATGERKVVLEGGHFARYIPTGHLVFTRDATLHAMAFDPEQIEAHGPAVPIVQGVATNERSGHAKFAVASNGTLIYTPGMASQGAASVVVHLSRDGIVGALTKEQRNYTRPRVAPAGDRVAVEVVDADSRVHIWVMDLETGGATQLTFEGTENRFPVWTPDGREVLFRSESDGAYVVYRKAADGAGEAARVLEGTDDQLIPSDVLPGNILVFQDQGEGGTRDILTFDLDGDGPATAFLATPADEHSARISPDGAWIAYVSTESGQPRVYARPYPSTGGGQRAVSEGTGTAPVWSPGGEELYFIGPRPDRSLMSVSIAITRTTLNPGRPQTLFTPTNRFQPSGSDYSAPYDVMPNGDGFVGVQLAGLLVPEDSLGPASRPQINVVLNWFEELKRLVPTE